MEKNLTKSIIENSVLIQAKTKAEAVKEAKEMGIELSYYGVARVVRKDSKMFRFIKP